MVKWNVIAELWKEREIPPPEVLHSVYINNLLRSEDKEPLMDAVKLLHCGLHERGIDAAILAVGSSTFSEYHWEVKEQLTRVDRFLGKKGERRYADIDIRVLVERTSPALTQFHERKDRCLDIGLYREVRKETTAVLSSDGYDVRDHWMVQKLNEDRRSEDSARNRRMYGIELLSLTTMLHSDTPLDIIIREQAFPIRRELEIQRKEEFRYKGISYPFSVLYPSHAMSK